jgi:hypothetical protein
MNFSDADEGRNADRQYEVGYGRPPEHSRFLQGQSGNPKGRPLGAKGSITLLKKELLAPALVKHRGRQVKTTKLHVIATQLVNQAVRGHYPSIRVLFKFAQLDRMLNEPTRERRGLSEEEVDLFRRALCWDPRATTAPAEHSKPIAPASDATSDDQRSVPRPRDEPYAIGYRKPPVHARFQKGRSGNPLGRPRVSKTFRKTVHTLLEEQVTVTENGCPKRCTKLELIFMQIVNQAAGGNLRFQSLLLEFAPALDIELHRKRTLPTLERIRKSLWNDIIHPRRYP